MRAGVPSSRSTDLHRRLALHDLERATRNLLQLIEVVVVPARVRSALEEPVRAVVGVDQAIALQGRGDHRRLAGEGGGVVGGLEPETQPHRRGVGRVRIAGAVGGGADPGVAGRFERDPHRVVDHTRLDLVEAEEAGEDRQAGGVGRGEPDRAQAGVGEVPDRAALRLPLSPPREGAVELVEQASRLVVGDHVTVLVAPRAALDRRRQGDPVLALVGLGSVSGEPDLDRLGSLADDLVGDPVDRPAADVGMKL